MIDLRIAYLEEEALLAAAMMIVRPSTVINTTIKILCKNYRKYETRRIILRNRLHNYNKIETH